MKNECYIEIVSYETGKVEKRMGPMPESKADQVETGLNRNLNHERYFTRVVEDKPQQKAKRACVT